MNNRPLPSSINSGNTACCGAHHRSAARQRLDCRERIVFPPLRGNDRKVRSAQQFHDSRSVKFSLKTPHYGNRRTRPLSSSDNGPSPTTFSGSDDIVAAFSSVSTPLLLRKPPRIAAIITPPRCCIATACRRLVHEVAHYVYFSCVISGAYHDIGHETARTDEKHPHSVQAPCAANAKPRQRQAPRL